MSQKALEFLKNSFLFDPISRNNKYKMYSDDELYNELQKYREYILSNADEIRGEVRNDDNKLNVCIESCEKLPTEDMYKQLILYIDQVVIQDPIFDLAEPKSSFSEAMGKLLGLKAHEKVNKNELCDLIDYIVCIIPLIDAGFVVMAPLSRIHERTEIPILYSPTAFSDEIPKNILDYYRSIAHVKNLEPTEKGLLVKDDENLHLGTRILIEFTDEDCITGHLYQYMRTKIFDGGKSGTAKIGYRPADSISEREFAIWVNQSVNQAANTCFDKIYKELIFSKTYGCMYLTQSNIVSKTLNMAIDRPSKEAELATMGLSLDLPITNQVLMKDLISIRSNYGDAFHNFRTELNSKLLSLDSCSDAESLRRQINAISYELNSIQVQEVEKEYRKISRTLKLDMVSMTGSLVASFATGGITAIGAACAFVKGIADLSKYFTDVHEHNGYFLWKLNKQAKKYEI